MSLSEEQIEKFGGTRKEPRLTGRQITTIAVALAVAVVLLPVGATAATQLMTLKDPSTSRKARVDTTNRLTVVDMPLTAKRWYANVNGGATIFIPPTGTTTLVIGSLTIANPIGNLETWSGLVYSDTACTTQIDNVPPVIVGAGQTLHLEFPEPLVISPGGSAWCYKGTNTDLNVVAVGYYY